MNLNVRVLTGFFERMRGLLGRDSLPVGVVYVFPHCNAVHTVGMRFAIDIAFLDAEGNVVSFHENVPPGRWLVLGGRRARTTLEASPGWLSYAMKDNALKSILSGSSGIPDDK